MVDYHIIQKGNTPVWKKGSEGVGCTPLLSSEQNPEPSKGSEKTHCLSKDRFTAWKHDSVWPVGPDKDVAVTGCLLSRNGRVICLQKGRQLGSLPQQREEKRNWPLAGIAGLIPPSGRHTTATLSAT